MNQDAAHVKGQIEAEEKNLEAFKFFVTGLLANIDNAVTTGAGRRLKLTGGPYEVTIDVYTLKSQVKKFNTDERNGLVQKIALATDEKEIQANKEKRESQAALGKLILPKHLEKEIEDKRR